uniref:RNase H type-1 domain-containing protein n=1 Tax=Cannabis sativa TaxID=3483 RepID=A0A803Q5M7_CANSA
MKRVGGCCGGENKDFWEEGKRLMLFLFHCQEEEDVEKWECGVAMAAFAYIYMEYEDDVHLLGFSSNYIDARISGNNGMWRLTGDMDNVVSQEDKRGGNVYHDRLIDGFNQALIESGLYDLEIHGYQFTWERDHSLILLDPCVLQCLTGLRKFRFENCWLREPMCLQVVKNCWDTCDADYNQKKISYCEECEVFWKQRSKQLWLTEGDRNIKFFHIYATNRKRKNSIVKNMGDVNSDSSVEEALMINWAIWNACNDLLWNQKASTAATGMEDERWIKPVFNTIKVNVDGVIFQASNSFGCGFLARNCDGTLIEVRTLLNPGCVSPKVAEMIGIKEALSWIKFQGWHLVTAEIDCLVAIQAMHSYVYLPSYFGLLVSDCK